MMRLTGHSTGSSENLILSNDGVEDGEVDKLINSIIRELDLTVSAIKNDEIDSLGDALIERKIV